MASDLVDAPAQPWLRSAADGPGVGGRVPRRDRANVETLRAVCAPGGLRGGEGRRLRARRRAGGRAAVEAGAAWLAVAQVPRPPSCAPPACAPILLLSEPRPADVDEALAAGVVLTAYTEPLIRRLGSAAPAGAGARPPQGRHRDAPRRCPPRGPSSAWLGWSQAEPRLSLDGLWTHCAVADEPDDPFTALQLERFDAAVAAVEAAGIPVPMRHAANSAAAIAHPASRYDLVRCGIALYGIPPAPALVDRLALEPAVRLATEVAFVKPVAAGERRVLRPAARSERDTMVATLPIGYADGVLRRLGIEGQDVLIGGRRRPMIGVVTMDQVLVDLGPGSEVQVGDEAVLLGAQGGERISPDEWAARLGTIAYEVGLRARAWVERRYGRS